MDAEVHTHSHTGKPIQLKTVNQNTCAKDCVRWKSKGRTPKNAIASVLCWLSVLVMGLALRMVYTSSETLLGKYLFSNNKLLKESLNMFLSFMKHQIVKSEWDMGFPWLCSYIGSLGEFESWRQSWGTESLIHMWYLCQLWVMSLTLLTIPWCSDNPRTGLECWETP